MKKILFSLLLAFTALQFAGAQRTLQYKDLTEPNDGFGQEDKAGLIISCDKNKSLSFESNLDPTVEIFSTMENGDKTDYCIIFDASDAYRGRQLSVKCPGYYTLIFTLSLRNGYISRYEVFDPDDAIDGTCFQMHREKGLQYFDDCNYLAAKEQFELAKQCDEIGEQQRLEAQAHIDNCDSIIEWRRQGNEAASILDYETAMNYFSKAQAMNSQDRYVVNRYAECSVAQSERSTRYLNAANNFMKNKEYEDAITMYKKVEALRERNVSEAISRRAMAERMLTRRKNAEHIIGLELGNGGNKLWGLHYGSYCNRTGGYMSIMLNNATFELFREYSLDDVAEVNITFGWTFPIVKKMNEYFQGLYLHLGPGFSLLNRFEADMDKIHEVTGNANYEKVTTQQQIKEVMDNYGVKKANDLLKLGVSAAVTPEIGLTVKVWHVALRGTYQYRYAIDKDYENYFKKSQWKFGIGWCF